MVIFLSNSFLKRTVCTPDIAFTIVDFPCATWPIVPTEDFKFLFCNILLFNFIFICIILMMFIYH